MTFFAAGVVDTKGQSSFFDFNISNNAASAEVDLFLRDALTDLRTFQLKRFSLFIDLKLKLAE
jgi:hypothetical protein